MINTHNKEYAVTKIRDSIEGSYIDSFVIEGYEFYDGTFVAQYSVGTPSGRTSLRERIDFGGVDNASEPDPRLLRLLTLACALSYYKVTLTNRIEVRFPLTNAEKLFLEKLTRGGLAEYAYRNQLPEKLEPSITGDVVNSRPEWARDEWNPLARPLVAVGGGKDSVVTIEAVKHAGRDPLLFSVNKFDPIDRCVTASGCDYVRVTRELDPELRVLNSLGAPNGHVPVTAINSLIALVLADIANLGPVVMSNEISANFGNLEWNGQEVNHQWSKSLEFEDLLRSTLRQGGLDPDRYFSLLRSYREIEIAEKFADYPEYFRAFTSCNRVFTLDPATRSSAWCCECPKCLFVFLILAPFIEKSELLGIFGDDLLDNPGNLPLYQEILGLRGIKPFECVGEYDEAGEALERLIHRPEWRSAAVVRGLSPFLSQVPIARGVGGPVDRVPDPYHEARDGVMGL